MEHDNLTLELEPLVSQLITHHGGGIIFFGGREGSGKSALSKALQAAAPDKVAPIFFSKALGAHLTALEGSFSAKARAESTGHDLISWVAEARALMAKRKKNIHPHLITVALYNAVRNTLGNFQTGNPGKILLVDGFPRWDDQPGMVQNIFSEFFPAQPAMLIEADCPRTTAYDRAIARATPTDTHELITAAHDEYDTVMPGVFAGMKPFADHLKVHASTTEEAKMTDFIRVLTAHLAHIEQHGFATASGERSAGARRVIIGGFLPGQPRRKTSSLLVAAQT